MKSGQKRLVYVSITLTLLLIFIAGLVAGFVGRSNSICADHRPPVAQDDTGPIGQIVFRCHNGQLITNND